MVRADRRRCFAYAYDWPGISVRTDEHAHRIVQRLTLIEIIENSLVPRRL